MNSNNNQLAALTVSIDDVAAAIGKTVDQLKRDHRRLTRDHGFPRPLPGANWRWPRKLVEIWIDAGGCDPEPAIKIVVANDDMPTDDAGIGRIVAGQHANLARRYGGE